MSVLMDYTLAKHLAAPTKSEVEGVVLTKEKRPSLFKGLGHALKNASYYLKRVAQEHNEMKSAPESWNHSKRGVYIRGLN